MNQFDYADLVQRARDVVRLQRGSGKTYREIGGLVGLPHTYIYRLDTGQTFYPRVEKLQRIVTALPYQPPLPLIRLD